MTIPMHDAQTSEVERGIVPEHAFINGMDGVFDDHRSLRSGNALYFRVRFHECLQFDFTSCTILESGDARLLEQYRDARSETREDNDCWQGFTDVVCLEELLDWTEGMTPHGCHAWVSGEDAEIFGVNAPLPCPLWHEAFSLAQAALEGPGRVPLERHTRVRQ
jgi:hypothetical protein